MILEKGNMWDVYDQTDLFLITANSTLGSQGDLIMGAGIAKEVKNMFPYLTKFYGTEVKRICGSYGTYGLIIAPERIFIGTTAYYQKIGLFQTKTYWHKPSTLELILRSTAKLLVHLEDKPSGYRVDLNFPGIGKGQLNREEVLPIISVLPDSVHIWELK